MQGAPQSIGSHIFPSYVNITTTDQQCHYSVLNTEPGYAVSSRVGVGGTGETSGIHLAAVERVIVAVEGWIFQLSGEEQEQEEEEEESRKQEEEEEGGRGGGAGGGGKGKRMNSLLRPL